MISTNTSLECSYCHKPIEKGLFFYSGGMIFCDRVCYNRFNVMKLFKWRCAMNPAHPANTIHEIVPRSLRPNDWWHDDNMIPLCGDCHDLVHRMGTKNYREQLLEALKNAKR
jgi:5-methylcytosine-specific restriction endonuclease McrA